MRPWTRRPTVVASIEIASPGWRASPSRNIGARWGMQQSADQKPRHPRQSILPVNARTALLDITLGGERSVRLTKPIGRFRRPVQGLRVEWG